MHNDIVLDNGVEFYKAKSFFSPEIQLLRYKTSKFGINALLISVLLYN